MRIGIDVGGTNTDAVLMDKRIVVDAVKAPTTTNVTDGIVEALQKLLAAANVDYGQIDGVMIGTTHFTNAVVERKDLQQTACIRLGLPATTSLPPMVDWPGELRDEVGGHYFFAHGGHEFDGRVISPFDPDEVRAIANDIRDAGISAIAVSSVFSPVNASFEQKTAEIIREVIPGANITLSSTIGRIGLLERENATVVNACLRELATRTVAGFRDALAKMNIEAPFYISQNDGTLMSAGFAADYPVLTFASGPTNSMRGAAFLSGLKNAIVVDIGGTTTDIGVLQHGFPRVAASAVDIGGVRTNFRMPDTYSIGLGGGTMIETNPLKIGPKSVGYKLITEGLAFGGDTLTTTDVIVAAGLTDIGDRSKVTSLDSSLIERVMIRIQEMVNVAVDRMKTSAKPIPVILVGGGSILVQSDISGASEIIRPDHFPVANAIGAAIAQVGGECDKIFSLAEIPREEALDAAKQEAAERAIAAGADPSTIEIVDIEEVPLAYLPGNATRIMAKAVGNLKET